MTAANDNGLLQLTIVSTSVVEWAGGILALVTTLIMSRTDPTRLLTVGAR
ncbi:hypothetical protein [Micromonospora sp. SL4-19]